MTTYEAERDEQLFSLFALSVSELSIFFFLFTGTANTSRNTCKDAFGWMLR